MPDPSVRAQLKEALSESRRSIEISGRKEQGEEEKERREVRKSRNGDGKNGEVDGEELELNRLEAFERDRRQRRRREESERAAMRGIFWMILFVIVCGWTLYNCLYKWDSVGSNWIIYALAAALTLYLAAQSFLQSSRG